MPSTSTIDTARTIPSVRARVYRVILDVLHSGHSMERNLYRYN